MAYRVEVSPRAARDLRHIYRTIHAQDVAQARTWFDGMAAAVMLLDNMPGRGALVQEDARLRQVFYGRRRHVYRIIYAIDEPASIVRVLHIRHGARDATPNIS